ncbi:MAG: hypothetical protein WD512_15655, partial [Candidatus Paceibacterota bacterium]
TLVSAGNSDAYIARYNADGTLAWAKSAGGTGEDIGLRITNYINADGSFAITGYFSNTATFGAGEANATTLVSAGVEDIYMAKYNANGSLVWARRAGGTGVDAGRGIEINTDGTILLTGYFQGLANFGQGGVISQLTSIGNTNTFISKYNANGTLD